MVSIGLRLAKVGLLALLVLELLLVYGVGSMLGALGEADDAKGPILLVGPLSVVVAIVVLWRFSKLPTAWLLAVGVFTGPFWSSATLGPASERNLWPFWAEAAFVASWPLWGWIPFRKRGESLARLLD